jgi:hypothetical protein
MRSAASSNSCAQPARRAARPNGPLAGDNEASATVVLVRDGDEHRITAFHNTLVATR